MAEIGGMLAASALKMAAERIAEAAGDRVMLQWKFSDDLEDMEDTVESIQAVLEDAEGQSFQNASVRLWLKRLTRASNDISDMFDEFEVNKTKKSVLRKLKVLHPCLKFAPEVGMASKMKKVRDKLEKISNHHHKFSLMEHSSSNVQQGIDERATSSEVVKTKILGRDEEKWKVMDLLTTPKSEYIILPIYGIGGMGKTSLAQLVFNDTHFKEYRKAWVYVGKTFDWKKIKKSVERQLCNTQKQDIGSSAPKDVLIVLDDLWEDDDSKLTDLKDSLKMVGNGCKVHAIVTTRYAGIAEKIKEDKDYKIEPLSSCTCWTIIKQIVGFEDKADKKKLEEIGKSIAEKCDGVALAARAIGYLLKSRDLKGWDSVQKSGFWNASRSGSSPYYNVLASLKLSYNNLPAYLRQCLAYCAIFPKGHNMAKHDLIYQWAALGFINWSDDISFWQNGETCIKQLLDLSFFQHSESPSVSYLILNTSVIAVFSFD
ncbi:hypothetical protein EJB05_27920, partial [Eragrostis curvula]